jgi:hypothetical protein
LILKLFNIYALFENLLKDEIRYNVFWKKWLVWNGRYWATDEGAVLIHSRGLVSIRQLHVETMNAPDLAKYMEIEKFAVQCESMPRRKACVEAASKIEGIQIGCEGLDRDEFLLNPNSANFTPADRRKRFQKT